LFLIGSAGTVYVSPKHLYIAIASPVDEGGATETDIYSFTLDGSKIEYAAQGTVNGALLNQFSLDESGGNLRLATNGIEGAGKYREYSSTVSVLDSSMERSMGRKREGSLKIVLSVFWATPGDETDGNEIFYQNTGAIILPLSGRWGSGFGKIIKSEE
jgi:hypothetical protein